MATLVRILRHTFRFPLRSGLSLLLDEATSALDNTTERLVQQALENLRSDRTCFVIAHRLSTVQKAARICVLHHGKLIEQGTHAELLTRCSAYAKLCEVTFANDSRPAA